MEDYSALKLPRRGMREDGFRKYEMLIGRACGGSVVVDPKELGLQPSSFISAFNEARRGYKHFRYLSKWIPITADVTHIRVFEITNGRVLLENKFADSAARKMQAEYMPLAGVAGGTAHANTSDDVPIQKLRFNWGSDDGNRHVEKLATDLSFRRRFTVEFICTAENCAEAKETLKGKGLEAVDSAKEAYVLIAL
jgi:hypothetical protein